MKRILLKCARLPFFGRMVGWCIAHFAHWLPLQIISENEQCIAFRHPVPSYDVHLLIVLKKHARDISCIRAEQFTRIVCTACSAIQTLGIDAPHIMLWANGGRFQEVRLLHFHLFPSELDRENALREMRAFTIGDTTVRECIRNDSKSSTLLILNADTDGFFTALPQLMTEYHLNSRGYSVFLDLSDRINRRDRFYIRIG